MDTTTTDDGPTRYTEPTIHPDAHMDHGIPEDAVRGFLHGLRVRKGLVTVREITLPEGSEVSCGLFGPAAGDAPVDESRVNYGRRGDRPYFSRLIQECPRKTRTVTLVLVPHEGGVVLATAYGGPQAPQEPGDPRISSGPIYREALRFWSQHALADERAGSDDA